MTTILVFPKIDGWLGYADGASIFLETGTPIDVTHPAVVERPELFTEPPASKPDAASPTSGDKSGKLRG